eukprot:538009-Rhodomonas_salina.1
MVLPVAGEQDDRRAREVHQSHALSYDGKELVYLSAFALFFSVCSSSLTWSVCLSMRLRQPDVSADALCCSPQEYAWLYEKYPSSATLLH